MTELTLDLNKEIPIVDDEPDEILNAIDRGLEASEQGRSVSLEDARKIVAQWVSKSGSQTLR